MIAFEHKLYFAIGLLGSVLFHIVIFYGIVTSTLRSSPILNEMDIVNITLLEEEMPYSQAPSKTETEVKPTSVLPETIPEELKEQRIDPKLEPNQIVKPKKVEKPRQKVIQKVQEVNNERLPEGSLEVKSEVAAVKTSQYDGAPMHGAGSHTNASALLKYLSLVRKKIQDNLVYPSMAKKMHLEGETMVKFDIDASGNLNKASLGVLKSSGTKILDTSALEAVLEASPFEKPPQEEMHIHIPVVFKLRP